MSFTNPDDETVHAMLGSVKTIAVVGFSPQPVRPANNISRSMQRYGFRIIPIRPRLAEAWASAPTPILRRCRTLSTS